MRGFRQIILIMFLMVLFVFLISCVLILADFIGIINLRDKLPQKYRTHPYVQFYMKKSKFIHKNIDEQVEELTRDQQAALDKTRTELEEKIKAIESDRAEAVRLKSEAEAFHAEARKKLDEALERERTFAERLKEYNEREVRLEEMALMYGRMEPDKAAAILSGLENKLVISVLRRIGEKKSAKILEFLDGKRATEVLKDMAK